MPRGMAETSRKDEVNYDAEKQVLILGAWKACLGSDTIYLFNVILSVPVRRTHFVKLLFKNDIFSVHQVLKKKKGGEWRHFLTFLQLSLCLPIDFQQTLFFHQLAHFRVQAVLCFALLCLSLFLFAVLKASMVL